MSSIFDFLSGNVPGGVLLFLLLIFIITSTIFYLYKVNEFFTKKLFYCWLIISLGILVFVYVWIWYKNPPQRIFSHYTIDEFSSYTKNNWLGKNLTEIISNRIKSYQKQYDLFFPSIWLYHMIPIDSVDNRNYRQNIYRKMPIQRVLQGKINSRTDHFVVELSLVEYPSEKIFKTVVENGIPFACPHKSA